MNTDFKVEDYLNLHKKRHEVEKISPDVLEDAMIVKSDLNDFNNIINRVREKSQSEEMNEFDIKKQEVINLYNGKHPNQSESDSITDNKGQIKKLSFGKKEGIPEMDYLFN